jgi:hypothetical protein
LSFGAAIISRRSRNRDAHRTSFPWRNAYVLAVEKFTGNAFNRAAIVANAPHRRCTENTMTGFKIVVAAALVSLAATAPAGAQLPEWAVSHPGAFQSQYPDRDVLNGGALTPAGRMGLERPGGAAPVFGLGSVYRAPDSALSSSYVLRYRSYHSGSRAFRGHGGRRRSWE